MTTLTVLGLVALALVYSAAWVITGKPKQKKRRRK